MLLNESTLSLTLGQTEVALPFTYALGTNELFVYLNTLLLYLNSHYEEVDSDHIRLLFQAKGSDTLTVGILAGAGGKSLQNIQLLPAPKIFRFPLYYPGTITLSLPSTSDSKVTHTRLYRRRQGRIVVAAVTAVGTGTVQVSDSQAEDEYFVSFCNPSNSLEGPASFLIRIGTVPINLPELAA